MSSAYIAQVLLGLFSSLLELVLCHLLISLVIPLLQLLEAVADVVYVFDREQHMDGA